MNRSPQMTVVQMENQALPVLKKDLLQGTSSSHPNPTLKNLKGS